MSKLLEQIIKDSLSSNTCRIGGKEVLRSVKNSKLIVCSKSLPADVKINLEQSGKDANVPIYYFNNTSMVLGRLCNKPFRISVISIDNTSKSDISSVLEENNK
ncbi:MAG: ribosomal L7Ae/L30e/S12e/Gadd45 family protein [Nitrososphaerales archaeon]